MTAIDNAAASIWVFIRAIVGGLLISILLGSSLFSLLVKENAGFHPELPWAAELSLIWLALAAGWLSGLGPPRSTGPFRHRALRLSSEPQPWTTGRKFTVAIAATLIAAIYVYFIVVVTLAGGRPAPDLSAFPTTSLRLSTFVMGAVLSGAAEEMAFRGYMQSQLERLGGPVFAILITSIVFMLAHAPQDLHQFQRLAVGYFVLALLWGTLAYRSGSILPGMALHIVGDLAVAYFIVLGGNGQLLFAHQVPA